MTSPPTRMVVLAAGASSRMGQAKALLWMEDHPLLDKHLQAYGKYLSVLVVLGHNADHIVSTWLGPDQMALDPDRTYTLNHQGQSVRVYIHSGWAAGQASSLQAGLRCLEAGEAALLTPVDCPPVPPDLIERILTPRVSTPRVLVPRYRGQPGHPVWLSPDLVELLRQRPTPLRLDEAIHHHGGEITFVDVEDPAILENINTPEALERWRREYRQRSSQGLFR